MNAMNTQVDWKDNHKYITFTIEGHKFRDNKLFDERYLKENLEIYFELDGCASIISGEYQDYETPQTGTISDDLFQMIGELLNMEMDRTPQRKWMPHHSRKEIEKMIAQGLKISKDDYEEYEEYHGMSMF